MSRRIQDKNSKSAHPSVDHCYFNACQRVAKPGSMSKIQGTREPGPSSSTLSIIRTPFCFSRHIVKLLRSENNEYEM